MIFNSYTVLGFDDRRWMLVGIPLVSLLINVLLFGDVIWDGLVSFMVSCQLMSLLYTGIYWLIFRQLYLQVTKRYPGYDNTYSRYMVLVPVVVGVFFLVHVILKLTLDPFMMKHMDVLQTDQPIIETVSSFVFIVLVITMYEGAHLFVELKESQIEKEQLISDNISSQLEGLKNQVNPHFLFNSLNTLASIIPEDGEKSIRFVNKLSKVYRYILELKDKKLVSVAEEFDFLKSYTFLLEERFGDNLQVDINVPYKYHSKFIVPLSLQITFENAIKHNIISKKQPLTIRVFVEDQSTLVISNNLQKKESFGMSPGLGLLNIKNRYKFFTKHEVKVEETEESFNVMLPMLHTSKFI